LYRDAAVILHQAAGLGGVLVGKGVFPFAADLLAAFDAQDSAGHSFQWLDGYLTLATLAGTRAQFHAIAPWIWYTRLSNAREKSQLAIASQTGFIFSGEITTAVEYIFGDEQRQGRHLQCFGLSPEPKKSATKVICNVYRVARLRCCGLRPMGRPNFIWRTA
jgi:hypothetical protein